MKCDRASDLRAIAEGRLMLNVRNGVTVSRSMLAKVADEMDALSTATPADVQSLADRLNKRATTLNGAAVGAGDGATYALGYYDQFAAADDRAASTTLLSLSARCGEMERALNYLKDAVTIGLSNDEILRRVDLCFAALSRRATTGEADG